MIIDIHTHTFPPQIAARALSKLSQSANLKYYTDGTIEGLRKSMKDNNINLSVLLPIATKPGQYKSINENSYILNENYNADNSINIISFGAIHPDDDNPKQIIKDLRIKGFKGIKLHPVFQGVYFDDDKYLRIIDTAEEEGLITITHGGYDVGYPGVDLACANHILPVIEKLKPTKLVAAHMGGCLEWDYVKKYIAGSDIYLDTSFSVHRLFAKDGVTERKDEFVMDKETFLDILRLHDKDKILFGTDSPWSDPSESISILRSYVDEINDGNILDNILYANSAKLLSLI